MIRAITFSVAIWLILAYILMHEDRPKCETLTTWEDCQWALR